MLDETLHQMLGRLPPSTVRQIEASPMTTVRPAPGDGGTAPNPSPLPSIPIAHGDLEVRGVLGEGGMGRVMLAHQRSLGRAVAVKSLLPHRRSVEAEAALLAEGRCAGDDLLDVGDRHVAAVPRNGDRLVATGGAIRSLAGIVRPMSTRPRRARILLVPLAALLTGACGASGGGAGTPRSLIGTWSLSSPLPNFTGSYKLSYQETLDGNDTFGSMALHTDVVYTATATVFPGCHEKLDYPGTFMNKSGMLTTSFIAGGSVNRTQCNSMTDDMVGGSRDDREYSARFTGPYTATTTALTINGRTFKPE